MSNRSTELQTPTVSALHELVNMLSSKYSTTLTFNSKKSDFQTNFPIPLELNKNYNYEIGLLWFSVYNIVFNVNKPNNKLIINSAELPLRGSVLKKIIITIPPGAYDFDKLFNEIKKQFKLTNDPILKDPLLKNAHRKWFKGSDEEFKQIETSPIDFQINLETARINCFIYNGYSLEFPQNSEIHGVTPSGIKDPQNGLRDLMGFQKYNYNVNSIGETNLNISNITSVNLLCDIVEGSFQNGRRTNCLYNFPYGTVPQGYRIVQHVSTPIYLPINTKTIKSISFKIVDQDGKIINFNNENISFSLHLKQV